MRPVLLLTAILLLCSLPARAQVPLVANAPVPGLDFLRSAGAEPDTTSPWRYFPLAVGNAWEYYYYQTGERRRVDVLGEETISGQHYYLYRSRTYGSNGNVTRSSGLLPVRFDTSTATVRFYVRATDEELLFYPCPLDAAFGDEVVCPEWEPPFEVSGGYDGALAFGGEFPGTGPDTVRTAVKTYYSFQPGNTLDYRYAADIGLVFSEDLGTQGIYYARVDGVEHGQAFYPVADEPGPSAPRALALEVYPNPFRTTFSVEIERAEVGAAAVEVVDVLGRVVKRQELERAGAGREVIRVDAHGLRAGVYLVRVRAGSGASAVRMITKL